MDRGALTQAILSLECDFPVDFSAEYLRSLSMERLRHIYLALYLHGKRPNRRRRKPKA